MKMRAAIKELSSFIYKENMLEKGDRVIIALSGGADSCFLLRMLCMLREDMALSLRAVHVHHGLRDSADRDEQFAAALCARYGIPFRCVRADAAALAREMGTGIEEAGRKLRYDAFEEAAAAWDREAGTGRCRIALAHHRNDQAETVLFHLCRGSSVSGLAGMQPVSGRLIRPLLRSDRGTIEELLTEMGQDWCTDETNTEPAYARNRIRNVILPALREQVNARTDEHIAGLAEDIRGAEEYLQLETQRAAASCRIRDDRGGKDVLFSVSAAAGLHPYIRSRVLYAYLAEAAGRRRDISRRHVEALDRLVTEGPSGGEADLLYGLRAKRSYDVIRIGSRVPDRGGKASPAEGKAVPEAAENAFSMRVFDYSWEEDLGRSIPSGRYTKWFDYDKIGQLPLVRTRRAGDRIGIDAAHTCTVRKYMIDSRIPAEERDSYPLICSGSDVLWVPGYRIHYGCRVDSGTKRVLEIVWHCSDQNES